MMTRAETMGLQRRFSSERSLDIIGNLFGKGRCFSDSPKDC